MNCERKPETYEPIFGDGVRGTLLAILYRPAKLLFIDTPCMAAVWVALAFALAWKHDNLWTVAHLGLACLYWAARKYFDPVIRAICAWIEGKAATRANP
jgi:hypothetical protein